MKKRLAAVMCLLAALFCGGCRKQPSIPAGTVGGKVASNGQLIASAQTQEEAEQIAALYGIELVDFEAPLALYRTDADPEEMIRKGAEMGWPRLEINHVVELF